MAGKPTSMSQIKQLLLMHARGKGKKAIARCLGMSKNTVKNYLIKLDGMLTDTGNPVTIADLVKLDNPELEGKFHSGNPSYKTEEERYNHLQNQMDYFLRELKRNGVSRHLLWEEYRRSYPGGYSYSQFCFHIQQREAAARPSMVLTHKPAEKLFIDFAGKPLYYVDKDTGERIACQVFVACLPYSDYSFAVAVPSQSVEDFIFALTLCIHFLDGVPELIVPDNLKSAIVKANRYEPDVNRALMDFASHYGATVVPARVKRPQDKALVENQVKLMYSRVYAALRNVTFFDIESLNKAIAERVKAHNQTRMQQKPYCREERFLAEEKGLLKPLPEKAFMLKYYRELTVAKNNHIYLSQDKRYYSVPYKYIGQKAKVIYTRSMVYIFCKQQQVAVHIRDHRQGLYSTNKEHLCSHHQHYLDRSPEYYKRLAQKQSESLYILVKQLFNQDKHPEQLYRTCDGLLSLSRKAEAASFEKACKLAIENRIYSYKFIKNVLANKMEDVNSAETASKPLPEHQNIRGKQYYSQLELDFYEQKTNH